MKWSYKHNQRKSSVVGHAQAQNPLVLELLRRVTPECVVTKLDFKEYSNKIFYGICIFVDVFNLTSNNVITKLDTLICKILCIFLLKKYNN